MLVCPGETTVTSPGGLPSLNAASVESSTGLPLTDNVVLRLAIDGVTTTTEVHGLTPGPVCTHPTIGALIRSSAHKIGPPSVLSSWPGPGFLLESVTVPPWAHFMIAETLTASSTAKAYPTPSATDN